MAFTSATAPAAMPLLDNTGTVQSMTYANLQALAATIANQSIAAWTKLNGLLTQINAATTVTDVQAVVWS